MVGACSTRVEGAAESGAGTAGSDAGAGAGGGAAIVGAVRVGMARAALLSFASACLLCWVLPHALTGAGCCWAGCCSSTTGAGAAGISSCLVRGGPRAHWFPVTAGAAAGGCAWAGAWAGFAARCCCCGAADGALTAGAGLGSVTFVGDGGPLPLTAFRVALSFLSVRGRSLLSRCPSTRLTLGAGAGFFFGSFLVLVSHGQPAHRRGQRGEVSMRPAPPAPKDPRSVKTVGCDTARQNAGEGETHV